MLFRMMCDFSQRPAVDARLLIAFFGSCLIVFVLGRLVARHLFRLDGVAGSVFALGGIFSNNVMLGLPIAGVMLGRRRSVGGAGAGVQRPDPVDAGDGVDRMGAQRFADAERLR